MKYNRCVSRVYRVDSFVSDDYSVYRTTDNSNAYLWYYSSIVQQLREIHELGKQLRESHYVPYAWYVSTDSRIPFTSICNFYVYNLPLVLVHYCYGLYIYLALVYSRSYVVPTHGQETTRPIRPLHCYTTLLQVSQPTGEHCN